jgi:hypothetical protein
MLILAGVAAATAALPAAFIATRDRTENLPEEILSLLSDRAGAAEIGRRWMAATGRPQEASALAQKIAKRLRANGWRADGDGESLHAAMAAQIRQEFRRDDLIDIAGWQITRTSAELCALAAVAEQPIANG